MIIFVTGATAGFGAEIARKFVKEGHKVIATGRRKERLDDLKTELGDALYPVELDVTNRASIQDAIDSLPAEWRNIDVLVNNAGLALGLEKADKASLEDCRVQLAAAQQVLSAAPENFDERIHKIEQEITEKKIVMKDVILYMSKRAEMTFSKLALNRVKISLYDVVKTTGELKDVFRFTYNGRRYDRLSLSEKIRAGAEVSELVKRLTGRNYPVFFDNMESVDDLSNIRPTSQMILAKCVRNAELSVRAGSTAMPKAA